MDIFIIDIDGGRERCKYSQHEFDVSNVWQEGNCSVSRDRQSFLRVHVHSNRSAVNAFFRDEMEGDVGQRILSFVNLCRHI